MSERAKWRKYPCRGCGAPAGKPCPVVNDCGEGCDCPTHTRKAATQPSESLNSEDA